MQTSKIEVLIFSGFNQRAIISFCRFCNLNNINLNIIASNKDDTILKTAYKSNVIYIRTSNTFTVEEFELYKNKVPGETLFILPSTEYLNRFLISFKEEIEKLGFIIPLCGKNLYEQISDKYDFGKLCRGYNIKVPDEFEFPSNFETPFVAKPKKYSNLANVVEKPVLIYNIDDYNNFKYNSQIENFYFQEFVGGNSYYLLFYFSKKGGTYVYSQENLIQQSDGRSIIAAKSSSIHQNQIAEDFIRVFNEIHFTGLVMVEIKLYNGKFYMIEANPRLWGPSQLILDAQMGLFHYFLSDYHVLYGTFESAYRCDVKYFWSGGIVEDQIKDGTIVFHNYTATNFFNEYTSLIANDVYGRPDTFHVYQEEKQI